MYVFCERRLIFYLFFFVCCQGWTLRKVLEEETTFDDAVERISTTPFCSSEYSIISGVKQGTILSLNPGVDGKANVMHRQVLGESNYDEPAEYIIMTNFDFYWHDIKVRLFFL